MTGPLSKASGLGHQNGMLFLRSLAFNIAFYILLFGLVVFGAPVMFYGRHGVFALARTWARAAFWLQRVICGVHVEFRGVENVPKGAFILAAKHQSVWETFALTLFAPDYSFLLKRELTWIPFFGWMLISSEQIVVDRAKGGSALMQAVRKSRALLEQGRQIIVFPEGTRRPVRAAPAYKPGVAAIYGHCNAVCVPAALNSGLFWPRRQFLRRPGTIVVEFLPPIQPGMDKKVFMRLLAEQIETASTRLAEEALARDPALAEAFPLPPQTEPAKA